MKTSNPNVDYAVARMRECARKAEYAKQSAVKRGQVVRAKVEREVFLGQRTILDNDLSTTQDALSASDPLYRSHASDNGWYIQQAIMWATVANTELELEKREQQKAESLRDVNAARTK